MNEKDSPVISVAECQPVLARRQGNRRRRGGLHVLSVGTPGISKVELHPDSDAASASHYNSSIFFAFSPSYRVHLFFALPQKHEYGNVSTSVNVGLQDARVTL